jgi:hypothetical protein
VVSALASPDAAGATGVSSTVGERGVVVGAVGAVEATEVSGRRISRVRATGTAPLSDATVEFGVAGAGRCPRNAASTRAWFRSACSRLRSARLAFAMRGTDGVAVGAPASEVFSALRAGAFPARAVSRPCRPGAIVGDSGRRGRCTTSSRPPRSSRSPGCRRLRLSMATSRTRTGLISRWVNRLTRSTSIPRLMMVLLFPTMMLFTTVELL